MKVFSGGAPNNLQWTRLQTEEISIRAKEKKEGPHG